MADFKKIVRTPEEAIGAALLALCRSVSAKRPRTVIDHILKYGIVTNEELKELYGYDHPPRAIRDVRENGVPLILHRVRSQKTGRTMGAYTFDDISKIRSGRLGGRKAFSKQFKQDLIDAYGARDAITGERLDPRYLQIDHRIPYEVAGDDNGQLDVKDFMLLDASSNRAKSWSCEQCENVLAKRQAAICGTCFWAFPERYQHIAEVQSRRVDIVWNGEEVAAFYRLREQAKASGIELADYIKRKLGQ